MSRRTDRHADRQMQILRSRTIVAGPENSKTRLSWDKITKKEVPIIIFFFFRVFCADTQSEKVWKTKKLQTLRFFVKARCLWRIGIKISTHSRLVDSPILINWTSPFVNKGLSGLLNCFFYHFIPFKGEEKYPFVISKRCRPWPNVEYCVVWSVSALFD